MSSSTLSNPKKLGGIAVGMDVGTGVFSVIIGSSFGYLLHDVIKNVAKNNITTNDVKAFFLVKLLNMIKYPL
jgi:hypothetical protein